MELFNELNNSSMQTFISVINNCILNGQPLDRSDLENMLANGSILSDKEILLIDKLFNTYKGDKTKLYPKIDKFVPILPNSLELEWLADVLHDPRSKPILSEGLREKLLNIVQGPPLPDGSWQQKNWHCPIPLDNPCFSNSKYIKCFSTALDALRNSNYLHYESYSVYGNNYSGEAVPYKIEYCTNTNNFNLIMWNEEKKWTFKSDFATITKLEIIDRHFDSSATTAADEYVKNMKDSLKPIILKLKSTKHNVFERCFTIFSAYDKDITRVDQDNFILKIYTRGHFDQQEIIQNILSLGSSVEVCSPDDLRKKIIEYIRESFTR